MKEQVMTIEDLNSRDVHLSERLNKSDEEFSDFEYEGDKHHIPDLTI